MPNLRPVSPHRAPLPYFGTVALWRAGALAGALAFRRNETFQRRSVRNRCVIGTAQGRHTLSVPLLAGKHEALPIAATRISYADDWRRVHYTSLVTAYGSAPFWEEYSEALRPLYMRKPDLLWDWNRGLVEWVAAELDLGIGLATVDDFRPAVDTRKHTLGPDPRLPAYPQVFTERTGFLSNLSVLDLLMCRGPAAANYLSAPLS